MGKAGSVGTDPLFVGLTRPSMFLGVSMMYMMLNLFGCMIAFIQTSNFYVIFIGFAIHIVGYIICFKEPLFLELIMTRLSKCNICKNKNFYGANSYDLF